MSFWKRIFKIGQSEAHSLLDKIENPVNLTEQGIRDMKENLQHSIDALAEMKALLIRTRNECEMYKNRASDYENKAMMLLVNSQKGLLDSQQADRLAELALMKKEENLRLMLELAQEGRKYETTIATLSENIQQLKITISKWESEARALKAKAKASEALKNVSKQLSQLDSSSTISMLEKMKEKIEKQEALAQAYTEISQENKSIDEEIDSAIARSSSKTSDALKALKEKLTLQLPEAEKNNEK